MACMMNNPINYFQGKKLLLTGGAGYLAANLILRLQDIDCRIIRFDRPEAFFVPVKGKLRIQDITGDISDIGIWDTLIDGVDVIFHFAAQTSVYLAEQKPQKDFDINVMPMFHLLEACREKDLQPAIIFSGTVTEAGLPVRLPVDETHPDLPITFYDLHKWMAENYLKYYVRQGVVKGAILRLVNVFGPGPASSSADRGVLNLMVRRALQGETLTVYGKGDYLRDYVYVDDVVYAFLLAASNIESINGKHFVIGSGEGHTIAEAFNLVKECVERRTDKRVSVVHVDPPSNLSQIETRNFVANAGLFRELTGWNPQYSLIKGIDRTIDSYL